MLPLLNRFGKSLINHASLERHKTAVREYIRSLNDEEFKDIVQAEIALAAIIKQEAETRGVAA